MAYLRKKYYYKNEDIPKGLSALYAGFDILQQHPFFSQLKGTISAKTSHLNGKNTIACVTKNGDIFANISFGLDASEWAYVFAHHLQKWRSKRIRCHLFLCDHTFHEKGGQ